MTDIATVRRQVGPNTFLFDWSLPGPDLESDDSLFTAIVISLMTDRQAEPDDELPDAQSGALPDRRGWWGDTAVPQATDSAAPDRIGSRLWLLSRAKVDATLLPRWKAYCEEALAWMVEDGVATQVTVSGKIFAEQALKGNITITRTLANGAPVDHRYDFTWTMTAQMLGTPADVTISDAIASESGLNIAAETGETILL